MPSAGTADYRASAARAFARSLNILLKYARLYGLDHKLTSAQFDTAWRELCAAMPADAEAGFLFGVSSGKLLLDGVPLESGPAERGFAQMLAAAGLASIYFSAKVTRPEFARLVDAFATGGSRPAAMGAELKRVFGKNDGAIRINEVRYVAQDGGGDSLPSQLAARAMGPDSERIKDWLSSPQKLLQLIAAADGEKSGERAVAAPRTSLVSLRQEDVSSVVKLLSQIGRVFPGGAPLDPEHLQQQVKGAPVSVQSVLQSALAQMATQVPASADPNLLIKVAEHLAVQFALERYEKGEVRVNAVRELLDRMGREIETLRKVLRQHEEKMGRAGMAVESYSEILDRQFWAAVPENGKRAVLLSGDAWCIPPRNIRDYVRQLLDRRDTKLATSILAAYIPGLRLADAEARRRTATGMSELAEMYAQVDPELLRKAIAQTGEQLQIEPSQELQSLLGATLVRLTQEAGLRSDFVAVREALECTDRLQSRRVELSSDIRRRMAVESRMRRFIGEVLERGQVPAGFVELLRREPRLATDELAAQYSRCVRREQCNQVVELAHAVGDEAADRLTEVLRSQPPAEAVPTIGLLTHLNPNAVRELLPLRIPQWGRAAHDAVIRQIGSGSPSERSRLLMELLDVFDPAILPEVMDEIGVTDDPMATVRLLRLAEGELPASASPYLQVKAIEALSRLRDTHAAPLLYELLQARGLLLGWTHPREVRIVAAQALMKLDSTFVLPHNAGLKSTELKLGPLDPEASGQWIRHRRYYRVSPQRALPAVVQTSRGRCGVMVNSLSLGGGKGERDGRVNPGSEATLNLQLGMRSLTSRVLVRPAAGTELAFEIIHIDHDDRLRLRHLIANQAQHPAPQSGLGLTAQ